MIGVINLTTKTLGTSVVMPQVAGEGTEAKAIAVQPGHSATIAVLPGDQRPLLTLSPLIFDNGVRRTQGGSESTHASELIWPSADLLVAGNSGLEAYEVSTDGVSSMSYNWGTLTDDGRATAVGDRLYTAAGKILSLPTLQLLDSYDLGTLQSASAPVIDLDRKRAYFLVLTGLFEKRLIAFNTDTRQQTGSRRIAVTGDYAAPGGQLVRVGSSRLAFRLADKLVFIDDLSDL